MFLTEFTEARFVRGILRRRKGQAQATLIILCFVNNKTNTKKNYLKLVSYQRRSIREIINRRNDLTGSVMTACEGQAQEKSLRRRGWEGEDVKEREEGENVKENM